MSNAPKVTIEQVEASIKKEEYVLLPDGRTTICLLTLDNGFTIRGESSCVCIENYNKEDGEKYSRASAVSKIWAFLGFRLADQLSNPFKNDVLHLVKNLHLSWIAFDQKHWGMTTSENLPAEYKAFQSDLRLLLDQLVVPKAKFEEPSFITRLHQERDELREKFIKLEDFIENNHLFKSLSQAEQTDLSIQRGVMREYLAILLNRIERTESI